MPNIPRISEAEWEVMKVLWENSPLTANQIIESLAGKTSWKPKTVKTLISRLLKKDAIGFEKDDRTYHYSPRVSKEECTRAESRSFLDRVYGGELNALLAGFIGEQKLSEEEIAELKRMLDRLSD
ncbi:BlaI family penicillinase repressor [Hydrogenispora ethanolica]|uniref:BlaI family penicillinase repressor n=1 Tax=Hydrogenispora ethanolica TaxID=1082276 RepID=A0A4R1SB15_HYDET|nr:BlaI/MecI/CopY family transcriptional regulator [Hydrogenispora ethanolica]TCL76434.1 BlaI family penicillinase repressor [Hydrogenispora ethanolica]